MINDNEGGNRIGGTAFVLATSTFVGLGIDAAINLPRTVYRREGRPKVQLAPHVSRGGGGVAMHVRF